MSQPSWKPTASNELLRERAKMLADIRRFFDLRNVMEVETPILANAPVTDPHLVNFKTSFLSPLDSGERTLYLQTSPEYAMKRLLCAGSGCIYQICKSFRNEEAGQFHNPEFTMLEWYRVGFDHWQLMNETDQLLQKVLDTPTATRMSYQDAFLTHLNYDPLSQDENKLRTICKEQGFEDFARSESNIDTLLQLLFSHVIEKQIGTDAPCIIYDFPASQSALARISKEDPRVAERFEVYYLGIELANGFHELSDAKEQKKRFDSDNLLRQQIGVAPAKVDLHLIEALNHGLPDCAGIAMGIDRLLMLKTKQNNIERVMAFNVDNA